MLSYIYISYIYKYRLYKRYFGTPDLWGSPPSAPKFSARPPAAPTPLSRSMLGPGGDLKVWFGYKKRS